MKLHFLGDSLTFGYGVPATQGWVSLVAEKLPQAQITNRGISGDTTGGMLARFQQDIVAHRPQFLHIMGGLNDIAFGAPTGQVQANLKALCHQAEFYGIVPILGLCPLPYANQVEQKKADFLQFDRIQREMQHLFQWLTDLNALTDNKLLIINYDQELNERYGAERTHFYTDGIHLNAQGNQAMAEIFLHESAEWFYI